jgi:hypothetical protein
MYTIQFVGVTVQVLATLPAVQDEKFLIITVLLLPAIVKLASHCTQSELSHQNNQIQEAQVVDINPFANCQLAFNTGTLSSSVAQLLVFTKTVVSAVSTSKSNVSAHQGVTIVLLNPSHAVNLSFKTQTVKSVALTATF